MDKVASIVFPEAVEASNFKERDDLSYKSSAGLEMTGISVVYPKSNGNARITLEIAGTKVFDDVPLAAVGVAYDGDPSYASRPCRLTISSSAPVKMKIVNPHATAIEAGAVSVVMYSHPDSRKR